MLFGDDYTGPVTLARGREATFGDLYDASVEQGRSVGNILASQTMTERAYDERIDAIQRATSVAMESPTREIERYSSFGRKPDLHARFDARLAELETQFPQHAAIIGAAKPPRVVARDRAREAEQSVADQSSRYAGNAFLPSLLGGFRASLEDPANVAAMLVGPMGRVGTGAKEVLWMGVKSGAANMAVEAASQPFVQSWRKEAGLDYGVSDAAMAVAAAGVLGFAMDAGIRSGYRAVQAGRGRVAILDDAGKVTGYRARADVQAEQALQDAAEGAPKNALVRKAADGDLDALHRVAKDAGVNADPAYRGGKAVAELEAEIAPTYRADGIDADDGFSRMVQAVRAAVDPSEPMPRGADPLAPARAAGEVVDDATARSVGEVFRRDGKPVALERIDPQSVDTDPSTFQFKGGGDGAGEIGTLAGVGRWDPMSANRVIVFERTDGTRVVADGHQRLGLARRLADQKPMLDGYVLREADGWTPADVRAIAAYKNLREGSGSIIDAAKILRERPDLMDGSLPLNNAMMRNARALSRLDDAAFADVVAGGADPAHGALVADLVEYRGLHQAMLAELTRAEPQTLREARYMIADMLEAGAAREVQATLFGVSDMLRPLHAERAKVLDKALASIARDKRLFALVDAERDRLTAAGNRIARGNADEAMDAAVAGEMIERLARTRGPVSDWLDEAARSVAAGTPPKTAGEAFAARVARAIEEDGVDGLAVAQSPARPRIDEPAGADAKAQLQGLEARFSDALAALKKPEEAPEQAVMFALRTPDRAADVIERASRLSSFSAGLSLRGLFDRQMRAPGYVSREPFVIDDVRIASRSVADVPLSDVRTIQKSVSVRVVKAKIFDDEGDAPSVFKWGDLYYVNDGNHRITAARAKGIDTLRAEVIELEPAQARAAAAARPSDVPAQRDIVGRDHSDSTQDLGRLIAVPERARSDRLAHTDTALLMGRHAYTARASAEASAIRADIEAIVAKVAPAGTRLEMQERLQHGGVDIDGKFDPTQRLMHIALSAADPRRVAFEEAGHALKSAGLFTVDEYGQLAAFARDKALRQAFDIDGRYAAVYGAAFKGDKARIEAALVEETVMQMLARHATGERFGGVIDRLAERFWKIVGAIRDALGVRGLRTVYDVFEAFERGDVAAREGAGAASDGTPRFAFAGEKAVTADKAALSRAKQMATAGADREAIWQATGWFKGVDTSVERRARPPWLDFDVSENEQNVRRARAADANLGLSIAAAERHVELKDTVQACKG